MPPKAFSHSVVRCVVITLIVTYSNGVSFFNMCVFTGQMDSTVRHALEHGGEGTILRNTRDKDRMSPVTSGTDWI